MAIVGIDLGTTNSLVAYYRDGESRLIPNEFGEYLTPSVVHVTAQKEVIVGKAAKELLITDPSNTKAVFKRFMGLDGRFMLRGNSYRPEELSAFVIKKLVEDAKRELQEEIEEAIISVPAYFDDVRRKATKRAGEIAGVRVERLINEPSAAALACRMEEREEKDVSVYLVFDFGGGTLDVSVVECFDNVISVNAVSGDNHLGGSDFDKVIADYICQQIGTEYANLSLNDQSIVLHKAEQLKIKLSTESEADIEVQSDAFYGTVSLTHDKLVEISANILNRLKKPIRQAINNCDFSVDDIDKIILVGGSSKMAIVSMFLVYLMGKELYMAGDSDETVARGLGYYAGMKGREEEIKEMVMTDICPFSLGMAVHNENNVDNPYFSSIIEKNSVLPISRVGYYHPVSKHQKSVLVEIYQGDEQYAKDNVLLDTIEVPVNPWKKEKDSIQVRYTYDINGILDVDVSVGSDSKHYQKTIVNKELDLSKEAVQEQLKKMEELKKNPIEQEENQYVIHLANALYKQTTNAVRNQISMLVMYFEKVLSTGNEWKIKRAREQVLGVLSCIDAGLFDFSIESELFDEEDKEETEFLEMLREQAEDAEESED